MKTRVLPISPDSIREACQILQGGDLVAFPTETVYGLGGLGLVSESVQKIYSAKGRPMSDPLILHLPFTDLNQARALGVIQSPTPPGAELLANAFWPGPLTLILPRGPSVPHEVTAGLATVAIRCPSHAGAQQLLTTLGAPLAAPSANRFGRISPTEASAVLQELNGKIPLILDGGPCHHGIESTVVAFPKGHPAILRPGVLTAESISQILGQECEVASRTLPANFPANSPGLLASHYAPVCPLYLCDQPIQHFVTGYQHILFHPPKVSPPSSAHILSPDHRPEQAAQNLYRILRAADAQTPKAILIEPIPPSTLATALHDRIFRASTGHAFWRNHSWELQSHKQS